MDNHSHYINIAGLQEDIAQKEKEYLEAIKEGRPHRRVHELLQQKKKMEKELALMVIANFDYKGRSSA